MKKIIVTFFIILPFALEAQSSLETILKSSEIIVSGLSFIKGSKSKPDTKIVEYFCVKNKLADKVTFRLTGKDEDGGDVKKEMVILNDGKECVYQIPKGVWQYEIILANKEIFKKGEFKIEDESTIIIKNN